MEQENSSWIKVRSQELFRNHRQEIFCRTDRLFAGLLVFQWLAGVATAIWISPKTWIGAESMTNANIWAAIFLGGAIASLPVYFALTRPGQVLTRHLIAVGQMLAGVLLIHLLGGRIETHFHIFGSLAFLAFYRDWRVLITASVVVALDHLVRGIVWPQSVYGVLTASPWRWLEHAGWVVFEDIFLIWSCRQGTTEMQDTARRQVLLEVATTEAQQGRQELLAAHDELELRVEQRTHELSDANAKLSEEIIERMDAETRLEATYQQFMEAARRAGMAEIATGVLHNVGNVLNGINVSATLALDQIQQSKVDQLGRVCRLLEEHGDDLGSFISQDAKGKQIPDFLNALSNHLTQERSLVLHEIESLVSKVEHIKAIVTTQQSYAGVAGVVEPVDLQIMLNDAIKLNSSSFERHHIEVDCDFAELPEILLDKQKVLQILVNLVKNAKESLLECPAGQRRIHLTTEVVGEDRLRLTVGDTGVGIPPENLAKIFSHGFTTKRQGHGFGLHSCANSAREIGGTLSVHSDGKGSGASFTLELPIQPVGVLA